MNSRAISRFPFSPILPLFLLNADDGGAGGGAPATPSAVSGKTVAEQVQEAITNLLTKKDNDPMKAMETLVRQNHALELRAKAAESSQISKEDRELLDQFKALNLTVADVTKKLEEHTQWGEERAKNAKLDGLKKAAQAAGYNADLLASLEGALDADYVVSGEGENAKAIVKVKGADGAVSDKPLADFVSEKWPALKDVLSAPASPATPQVAKYGQSAGVQTGKAATNIYDQIREQKAADKKAQTSGHWTERAGVARR